MTKYTETPQDSGFTASKQMLSSGSGDVPDAIPVERYDSLPSTNLTAKALLAKECRRAVVIAKRQTAGRGRLGRSFFSEGGIYLSAAIPAEELSIPAELLTSAAAAAVCRAVDNADFPAQIKWVNDIFVHGKKICGILAEAVMRDNQIIGYVVGIGINTKSTHLPKELADTAGVVFVDDADKEMLIETVIRNFFSAIREAPASIVAYCAEKSCVIGKSIRYFGAAEGTGIAAGLAENGGLIVRTEDSRKITLTGGEISVRLR